MEARAAAAPTYVRRESAPRRAWAWLKKRALNIYAGFAIAYLLIPIAVIIAFSFNNPAGKYNFTWEGFTLKHWADVFSLPDLNSALVKSLEIALVATIVATIIGTLMALALVRYQFFGRRTTNFLIVIPMATPEIVMGASLLSFFLIRRHPGARDHDPDDRPHHVLHQLRRGRGAFAPDRLRPQPRGGGPGPRGEPIQTFWRVTFP